MLLEVRPLKNISAQIEVPPDKSISHRAIMLSSIADGTSLIENFLGADDCLRTAECFRQMGIEISRTDSQDGKINLSVSGKGMKGLSSPKDILYVGNSGTTMRLLLGILAGQELHALLTGDESIKKRPMKRIVTPLRQMGALIHGRDDGNFAPIEIKGGTLKAIEYSSPVPSAQVKSALMLAALFAEGTTKLTEPSLSRDHTERMFEHFGIPLKHGNGSVTVEKREKILPNTVNIPGDISSAAFFMIAAAILPDSEILIKNVGLNPTRTGIIDVLRRMGAYISVINDTVVSGEPRGDVVVRSSRLNSIALGGNIIPRIIDEIPVICVAASFAEGNTIISDAKELRIKESDRIATISAELNKLGADITPTEDGMIIKGIKELKGGIGYSHGDHRIAMSLAIAGLASKEGVSIDDTECVETSFPGFERILKSLSR